MIEILIILLVILAVELIFFLNYRLNTKKLRSKNVKVVRVIDNEADDDFTRGAKEFYYRLLLELGPEQEWEKGRFFSTPSVADLGNTVFHKVIKHHEQLKQD